MCINREPHIWITVVCVFALCFLAFDYVTSSKSHYNRVDRGLLASGINKEEFKKITKETEKQEIRRHIETMKNRPKYVWSWKGVFDDLTRGYRYPKTIEEEIMKSRRSNG